MKNINFPEVAINLNIYSVSQLSALETDAEKREYIETAWILGDGIISFMEELLPDNFDMPPIEQGKDPYGKQIKKMTDAIWDLFLPHMNPDRLVTLIRDLGHWYINQNDSSELVGLIEDRIHTHLLNGFLRENSHLFDKL